MQGLVVVYPRVEQRIAKRHDDEEHQYALVLHHFNHLTPPYVKHIGEVLSYSIKECRHNSALRF